MVKKMVYSRKYVYTKEKTINNKYTLKEGEESLCYCRAHILIAFLVPRLSPFSEPSYSFAVFFIGTKAEEGDLALKKPMIFVREGYERAGIS